MLSILFYQIRKLKPKVIQLVKEKARIQTRSDFEVTAPSTKNIFIMSSKASHLSSSFERLEYKTDEIMYVKIFNVL